MARIGVDTLEDKRPRNIRYAAYNLRVHQVAEAYERGRDAGADTHIVENDQRLDARVPHVEPQSDEQSDYAAVRRKPLIADILPCSVGKVAHRDEHLDEVVERAEEIAGFIEQAMTQRAPKRMLTKT